MKPSIKKGSSYGEPWVWLSAWGLNLGILMVIAIVGLIFFRGLETFWPKQVILWELAGENPGEIGEKLLGPKILEHEVDEGQGLPGRMEIQIFQGNREVFGEAFRYFSKSRLKAETYPTEIIWLDRLENGKAMGYPKKLIFQDGSEIAFHDPKFIPSLKSEIKNGKERWEKIKDIEKHQIGKINRNMEKLRLQKQALMKEEAPKQKIAPLDKKLADYQKQYEVLSAQARKLREFQGDPKLVYQLANGQDMEIPTSEILHYYFPNQLNFFERGGVFGQQILNFISEDPREANTEGGIFPAIFGTLVMTILMSLAVVPLGVIAAIYLTEYAKEGLFLKLVRTAINNLAGVPSIVFGVFGLGFFVYLVGGTIDSVFFSDRLPTPTFGTGGIFWASLTLALLTLPVVIVATEEALTSVPQGIREGALALGASKWQSIRSLILPAAAPGVLTGAILAMARGAGEVAPLMLVGVVKLAPSLPIDGTFPFLHLDRKFMHLGFHIFDLGFQSPDSESAIPMVFATTLLLIVLVLLLNLSAIIFREKLKRKYATSHF